MGIGVLTGAALATVLLLFVFLPLTREGITEESMIGDVVKLSMAEKPLDEVPSHVITDTAISLVQIDLPLLSLTVGMFHAEIPPNYGPVLAPLSRFYQADLPNFKSWSPTDQTPSQDNPGLVAVQANNYSSAETTEAVTETLPSINYAADIDEAFLNQQIASLETTPANTALMRGSGLPVRWHFNITPESENPSSYWEVGLHLSPWLSSSSY